MNIKRWPDRLCVALLFVGAFAWYVGTLGVGPYPGYSAYLVAARAGVFPNLSSGYPIWRMLCAVWGVLPFGDFATRLNALSALTGALCIPLLYLLMRDAILLLVSADEVNEGRARVTARIGGIVAALALMFSTPFWWVSTRAYMTGTGLLILLICIRLVQRYAATMRFPLALILVFLYGIGLAEFPTMLVFGPLIGIALIYALWRAEHLSARYIVPLVAVAVLGLSLYFLTAWHYSGSVGSELRGDTGFFNVLWRMWREQIGIVMHSLPRTGWLVILCVSVLPWLAVLSVAGRGLSGNRDWSQVLLHLLMSGLACAVLLNVDKLSPWAISGSSRILVTPYLLTASLLGYLAAYWFLLFQQPVDADGYGVWSWRGVVSGLFLLPVLVLVVFEAAGSGQVANARASRFLNHYVNALIDGLGPCDTLVTDGGLDNHLLLAARERGLELKVLDLSQSGSSLYRRHLANQFDDPTLKNAALLGVMPLIEELVTQEKGVAERLAVLANPDLWFSLGYEPVPDGLMSRGVRDIAEVDLTALEARSVALAERLLPVLSTPSTEPGLERLRQNLQRQASMVSNNLGVLHQRAGDYKQAWGAYCRARAYLPSNISALLNLGAMVDQGDADDSDGEVGRELEALRVSAPEKFRVWSLSAIYGYVHLPQVYAQLGWTWARSGDMKQARARLQQAKQLFGAEEQERVQRVMARVHLMEGDAPESVALYRQLLVEKPDDMQLLQGLSAAHAATGDIEEALAVLSRAEAAGMNKTQVLVQRAQLLFQKGEAEAAEKMVDDLLLVEPDLLRGWVLKAELLLTRRDRVDLQGVLRRVEQAEGYGGYYGSYLRARQALSEKDLGRAQEFLLAAWQRKPKHTVLLEWALQLAVARRDREAAHQYVKALLVRDPESALGRYIMATLQLQAGETELAKDNLRRSLKHTRLPAALNDLAWVLQLEGVYDEAEALAREAVAASTGSYEYLETLGVVLLRQKKHGEAREVLERALLQKGSRPGTHLYLAQALAGEGKQSEAMAIVNKLREQRDALSPEQDDVLTELTQSLQ